MAQNLQLLKRRISTSKNIAQIAKAMEMISAAKIKKAQAAATTNNPYAQKISRMTSRAIAGLSPKQKKTPLLTLNSSENKLIIAISPDRGLCGSLNTNLNKKLLEQETKNTKLITLGKKIELFGAKLDFEYLASYPMGTTLPNYLLVYQLKNFIVNLIEKNEISEVYLLYAEFKSLFTQTPVVQKLLPFEFDASQDTASVPTENSILFEPPAEEILVDLLPYYLEVQIYNALLQAYTSEQAARMMAMQNAKNNAKDIAEYLTLVYNKSRQERITNEILDLANSQS